eukprot:TRINITY_DN4092_c0_g1_i1.p1 TRINITY_DN4092_c0_g1~~TRINITY_DN4092_c0_g1_i1.p1  ORF type:complete len:540 (+),score=113.61 TRINITY_DN4092_c0_g1_i1:21-1640(+)
MTDVHQFNNITLGGRISSSRGTLKVSNTMFMWRTEGGRIITVLPVDLAKAFWIRLYHRVFQLKLQLKLGTSIKFDGFRESDHDVLKSFLEDNFQVSLEPQTIASKGTNWGEFVVQGPVISMTIDEKQAFEIPLSEISNATMQPNSKNEVVLELNQDSTLEDEDESLVDIRFFIPNRPSDDTTKKTTAQMFHQSILDKVDVSATSGKGIATLPHIPLLTPRGKYDIELFPTFMKLHGISYDYKIAYDSVARLFQLPKPDQTHVFFIASLDPPIRQGATKYPHLVMNFSRDTRLSVNLNITPELKEKFPNLPESFDNTEAFDIVNKLFHILTTRKITTPSSFKSHGGTSAIRCALKANEGFLYPLERSFFFVHKPPTYIRFEEIASVEFARVSSGVNQVSNRTFDLVVQLTDEVVQQFTGILRQEYTTLFNFIVAKKIRIVNPDESTELSAPTESGSKADQNQEGGEKRVTLDSMVDDEDSEEDEDFVGGDESSDEDEVDDDDEGEDEATPKKSEKDKEKSKKRREDSTEKPKKKPKISDA